MNQKELYLWGKNELEKAQIQEAPIKARKLLEFILKQTRNQMICNMLEKVNLEKQIEYEKQIEKIKEGMPIQYITHSQEFMGLEFYVDENVLIPQPDTEIVVEVALKLINEKLVYKNLEETRKICILDLCAGSGCIGISLAKNLDNANIVLSDIQEKALEVAKKNVQQNELENKIKIVKSNLFENLPQNTYNIIVSNPPYIETDIMQELSKEVRKEPKIALDGGKDGLFFYNKILEEAYKYLKKNGYVVLEIGYNQANLVLKIAKQAKNWKAITLQAIKDLGGNDRVLIFQKRKISL